MDELLFRIVDGEGNNWKPLINFIVLVVSNSISEDENVRRRGIPGS